MISSTSIVPLIINELCTYTTDSHHNNNLCKRIPYNSLSFLAEHATHDIY